VLEFLKLNRLQLCSLSVTADQWYKAYGLQQYNGPVSADHRFIGQKQDGLGLQYFNARYYDPSIGTFISPDTIVPEPGNPHAFNRYSYVGGRVMNTTDPTGHFSEEQLDLLGIHKDGLSEEVWALLLLLEPYDVMIMAGNEYLVAPYIDRPEGGVDQIILGLVGANGPMYDAAGNPILLDQFIQGNLPSITGVYREDKLSGNGLSGDFVWLHGKSTNSRLSHNIQEMHVTQWWEPYLLNFGFDMAVSYGTGGLVNGSKLEQLSPVLEKFVGDSMSGLSASLQTGDVTFTFSNGQVTRKYRYRLDPRTVNPLVSRQTCLPYAAATSKPSVGTYAVGQVCY